MITCKSKLEAAFKQALEADNNERTLINAVEALGSCNKTIDCLSLEEIIYLKLVMSLP
ncbi:hypothetical protein [Aliivibrio fischeri]|uniref:hypothetical protein n=1 Tax=Aliivibrio fischeri TaxID=668 RepID=UPI0012DADDEA|nr:hypothetical protein [Aliivibrio fischeri]MUK65616.1 hypothetical protein [Aliivibrio fischeri]